MLDADESTHRVVTRQPPGVEDWDETGRIAVENRVVEVVMRYGTAVHLSVESDAEHLGSVTARLERVGRQDRVFPDGRPEYRATLPEDGDVVRSALAVDPGDTGAWVDRLHGIREFAVVTPDAWLYRSVPHHAHVREVNADGRDEMLAAVTAELDSIPRSGVVPVDGFASWRSGDCQYQLTWDVLRRREATDEGRWTAFELSRLRRVSPRPDRAELLVRWERPSADSWPRRLLRRVLRPESVRPPTRIEFPETAVMDEAVEGLRSLQTNLDYRFAVEDQ